MRRIMSQKFSANTIRTVLRNLYADNFLKSIKLVRDAKELLKIGEMDQ